MLSNLHPNDPRIQFLIREYLHGHLSKADIEELERWISVDPQNMKAFIKAGSPSNGFDSKTDRPEKARKKMHVVILCCAGVLILSLGWVVYGAFMMRPNTPESDVEIIRASPFNYGPGITSISDSLLAFRKASIADIMKAVGHCCHTNVIYVSDTPKGNYSGQIDCSLGTASVVKVLESVGIKADYDGKQIVVAGKE